MHYVYLIMSHTNQTEENELKQELLRQEKEYHIWLAEEDNLTEVMVADEKDTPLADGDGIKLLRTLYETIKDDQEKKAGE